MPRRVSLIVFLGLVTTLVLTTGISAGAVSGAKVQTKEVEIATTQQRLMDIRTKQSVALAAYNQALSEMNELNGQIATATDDLEASEVRLAEAQRNLEERASQVYKSGNVAFIDVMVGVNNFSEFAARMDLWLRLLAEERAAFDAVLETKNELAAHKAKLENQRAERVAAVEEALAQREEAASTEVEAEAYLASLNDELRAEIQARQEERAQRYAELAAQAIEEQAPVEQQSTAQATAQPTAQAAPEAPERVAEVATVEETPVVPQGDTAAQQEAADEWVADAQTAAEAAQLRAQQAAERRAAAQAAAEAAAAEAAAAQKAAAQDARQEEREQARIAAERAAARQAEREQAQREAERAARRAEIEQAAAEQAAEERAAERAAARRAAERQAERAAIREERRADRVAERRAEERRADRVAERRAEERRAAKEDASASASASASATATATSTATATASAKGGGGASCNDTFGGVAPHVAQAGCDIQAKFGLMVQGINGSPYHTNGLSLDIFTTDVALGNQVRDYAWANYNVDYTIWQDVYLDSTGYTASGYGHFDHVHVTFF